MTNATPTSQGGWTAEEVRNIIDTAAWLASNAAPSQDRSMAEDWYATRDGWFRAYQAWQDAGRPLAIDGMTEVTFEGHDPVSRRLGVLVAMGVRMPEPPHFIQPLEFGEATARAAAVLDEWVNSGEMPQHPLKPIREYLTTHRPGAIENYGDPVSAVLAELDWADDQVYRLRAGLISAGIDNAQALTASQVMEAVVKLIAEADDGDKEDQAAEQLAESEPQSEVPDDWA